MHSRNFSVRTEDEKLAQIDALAKAQDRSRNYIVNQAIERYLDEEQRWTDKVKAGLAAAQAGDFASPDEVDAVFQTFEDQARGATK